MQPSFHDPFFKPFYLCIGCAGSSLSVQAFLLFAESTHSLVVVRGLHVAVAPLSPGHTGFSNCGTWSVVDASGAESAGSVVAARGQ